MFADRATIMIRSGKVEMVTSAFEENCMFQTAVPTAETAAVAEM